MRTPVVWLRLALFAVLGAVASGAHAQLSLSPKQIEAAGIETANPVERRVPRTYSAIGHVLDSAGLVSTLTELQAAELIADASRNELRRAEQLHASEGNVAQKTVEANRAQAAADSGRAAVLQTQLQTVWGPALGKLNAVERQRLVSELTAHRIVLLTAEPQVALAADAAVGRAEVNSLAGHERWQAIVMGAMPNGQTPALASAYLMRMPAGTLVAGMSVLVELQDTVSSIAGVEVPRSAVIRWQGGDWLYRVDADGKFARLPVHPLAWTANGCLVDKHELATDQRVVVAGATVLLAAETTAGAAE